MPKASNIAAACCCALLSLAFFVVAATIPRRATADPQRFIFAAGGTYAYLVRDGRSEPAGGGASASFSYALNQTFAIGFAGLCTFHGIAATDDTPGGTLKVISGLVNFSYAMDLAELTPKIEAGLGVFYQDTPAAESATNVGGRLGLSLDYWLTRWLALGLGVYYHVLLSDPTEIPVFVEINPRVVLGW